MTVHMKPHEPIRVTTALSVSDDEVLRFLDSKSRWIQKNRELFAQVPRAPERIGETDEIWMFRGQQARLVDALTLLKAPFVVWSDDRVTVYWPESLWNERHLHRRVALNLIEESLRKEASALILERVQFYATRMALKPARVRFMSARTRWGSCSSRGSLNFNWKLIGAPLDVVDAIVVHELAHLRHMNHSDEFWDLVQEFAPWHEAADEWLRKTQHLL